MRQVPLWLPRSISQIVTSPLHQVLETSTPLSVMEDTGDLKLLLTSH